MPHVARILLSDPNFPDEPVFSPVALEIQGRIGRFDVVEVPDALPNIVGQIPLEDLDWVVDCKNQKLIPNPEHKNGELADEF